MSLLKSELAYTVLRGGIIILLKFEAKNFASEFKNLTIRAAGANSGISIQITITLYTFSRIFANLFALFGKSTKSPGEAARFLGVRREGSTTAKVRSAALL